MKCINSRREETRWGMGENGWDGGLDNSVAAHDSLTQLIQTFSHFSERSMAIVNNHPAHPPARHQKPENI